MMCYLTINYTPHFDLGIICFLSCYLVNLSLMQNQSTIQSLCVGNDSCIPAADNKKGGTDLLAADESPSPRLLLL